MPVWMPSFCYPMLHIKQVHFEYTCMNSKDFGCNHLGLKNLHTRMYIRINKQTYSIPPVLTVLVSEHSITNKNDCELYACKLPLKLLVYMYSKGALWCEMQNTVMLYICDCVSHHSVKGVISIFCQQDIILILSCKTGKRCLLCHRYCTQREGAR